jgi:hypothetical protein
MLYSGIDLHRRLIVICPIDQDGAILARASIKNDPMRVVTYFCQWTNEHHAVVERTGNWY